MKNTLVTWLPVRVICLMLVLLVGTPVWAVVTSDTPGSHVVTPGVPVYGINLDGVALLGTDTPNSSSIDDVIPSCSGALISDRYILTAAHCFDENRNREVDPLLAAFPFVAAFELADRSVLLEVNIDTVLFAPAWPNQEADLAVLELVENAPASLPRYRLYGLTDEVGQAVVLTGYGATGHGASGVDNEIDDGAVKRAGLNRYDAVRDDTLLAFDFDSGLPDHNALALAGFESDLGFGSDEVNTAPGDSGSPTFVGGAIGGVAAFTARIPDADITDQIDSSWGEVGFDVRISSFRNFLIAATGGAVVFVPEPSSMVLGTLAAVGLLLRRIR